MRGFLDSVLSTRLPSGSEQSSALAPLASLLLILLTKSLMTCLAASGGTFDCPGSGGDELSGGFGPFGGGTAMAPPPPPPVPLLTRAEEVRAGKKWRKVCK